jgi:formylglycine-generating enzyme required for sulfatase activity
MPLFEAFIAKLAASLAAGIIKESGSRLRKRLGKSETKKALERCARAAVAALVGQGFPDGTEIPREHLEDVLGHFANDEDVHDVLARAIREADLPASELAALREAFEAEHPPETLPGFDVERGIAAFVTAFVDQADGEEAFQGVIQTGHLRAQTEYLRKQLEVQEEIRDRLSDPRKHAKDARTKYLGALRHRCLMLPVTRLLGDEGLKQPPTLERVYVELDTKTPKEGLEERTELRRPRGPGMAEAERPSALAAVAALAAEDQVVLLGDAGSGKSTFARAVLAQLAASALHEDAEPPAGLSRDLVPVFVVLRELSSRLQALKLEKLSGEKRTRKLAEALREQALADLHEEYKAGDFEEGLAEAIVQGRCFLALDGLDEVPERFRGRVREAVVAIREHLHPAKTLVTCRVRSYGGGFTLPGFTHHELAPFDEGKIRNFCKAWYRAQGDLGRLEAAKVEPAAEDLERAVLEPALRDLAENPLLLTTTAVLHTRKAALPRERARVYEESIQLLVRDWQRERVGERLVESAPLRELLLDDSRLWPLLQRIAYEAHRIGGTAQDEAAGLPKGDLWALLSAPEHLGSAALAEAFLTYADLEAGLLVGLGGKPGQPAAFGFVHRTFQEYLAGRYLTTSVWDPVAELYERAGEGDLWGLAVDLGAEALLYVDRSPTALLKIAYGLGRADGEDTVRWRRALLWAGKMAALLGGATVEQEREGPVKGAVFLAELRPKLVGLLGSDLPPVERAEAGRVLARLGDAREEVLTVDAMELRRVPAGRFVMGSPEGEEAALDAEHPQRELEIPYDYWVSRYPVTQAQYREFIDAGGYGEERFWPEAREHRVWQDGRVKARWEETLTPGPERYGEPWDLANHPAVGVSWYEALAFCRWVTERWRANGRLPEGWHVCLPSEAEWEKAARGGLEVPAPAERCPVRTARMGGEDGPPELRENPDEARRYPWQGELSIERANTRESGIGTTSAVGCFPDGAGPYGCEELAGNVWEWTRSLRGDDPYPDELAKRATGEDLGSEDPRVLRGGAFFIAATFARCSARDWGHPGLRDYYIGFRVSSSPFSSDL